MTRLTPNLIVSAIEPCLAFWVDRLGFEKTVEVPRGDALGFVILRKGDTELMLQSEASLADDVPELAGDRHGAVLYVAVDDLEPIRRALTGYPRVTEERTTFYGARELIVRDPAGNVVFFAAHASEA